MAHATATIREVKNKDTGIDLTVNSYKETKAMIGATYEYQVMVVSNLSFFKTAKHKESDTVQFTVLKKFNEFEELYTKLNAKFSGTVFPPLPRKVLMMSDAVAKERRAGLDHIVKYIAMTPKICTSPILLEFLGVSSIKAGKFRKMEVSDAVVEKQGQTEESAEKMTKSEGQESTRDMEEDLFETGAEGPEDQADDDDDDDDLFADDNIESRTVDSTRMFEDQDLAGAFDEGEADDLFLPDAKVERTRKVQLDDREEENENDDLFRIEDNLDEIMQLNLKPKAEEEEIERETETKQTDSELETTEETKMEAAKETETKVEARNIETEVANGVETEVAKDEDFPEKQTEDSFECVPIVKPNGPEIKPKPRPKPAARPKPGVKPKPAVKPKPSLSDENTDSSLADTDSKSSQSDKSLQKPVPSPRPKPPVKQKPTLAVKPVIKPKPKSVQASTDTADASESLGGLPKENISEDDIMKYIQDNTSADDVDLFS